MEQIYVSQPRDEGGYEVARWNALEKKYVVMPAEVFNNEEDAKARARALNEELETEK